MSALAVAPRLFDPPGGGPTLDDLLVGAWEGLAARLVVECPVCGGELVPRGPGLEAGRCESCHSALSAGAAGRYARPAG